MRIILAAMIAASFGSLLTGVTLAQMGPEIFEIAQAQAEEQGKGKNQQPQGNPGNLETKPGEAPASSPQGETPGGMQSAPKGATKSNDQK